MELVVRGVDSEPGTAFVGEPILASFTSSGKPLIAKLVETGNSGRIADVKAETTGAQVDGKVEFRFEPPEGGVYRVEVWEADGTQAVSNEVLIVSGFSGKVDSGDKALFETRALDEKDVGFAKKALGAECQLLPEQSFVFAAQKMDGLTFVSYRNEENSRFNFSLLKVSSGGYLKAYDFPLDTFPSSWKPYEIEAIGFGDFNRDGVGPDVIVIISYATGIGPDGAKPSPAPSVYIAKGPTDYAYNKAANQVLLNQGAVTIDEVAKLLESGEVKID